MSTREPAKNNKTAEKQCDCAGFHDLLDWQVVQYREAVDTYRMKLSKKEQRFVSWEEAEQAFSCMNIDKVGEQWRVEYCGRICPERSTCLLASRFMKTHQSDQVYKTA